MPVIHSQSVWLLSSNLPIPSNAFDSIVCRVALRWSGETSAWHTYFVLLFVDMRLYCDTKHKIDKRTKTISTRLIRITFKYACFVRYGKDVFDCSLDFCSQESNVWYRTKSRIFPITQRYIYFIRFLLLQSDNMLFCFGRQTTEPEKGKNHTKQQNNGEYRFTWNKLFATKYTFFLSKWLACSWIGWWHAMTQFMLNRCWYIIINMCFWVAVAVDSIVQYMWCHRIQWMLVAGGFQILFWMARTALNILWFDYTRNWSISSEMNRGRVDNADSSRMSSISIYQQKIARYTCIEMCSILHSINRFDSDRSMPE